MQLAFFRRHRTFFMVLMGLGVLGFLFFGSWSYMREKFDLWLGSGSGREVIGQISGKNVRSRDVKTFFRHISIAGRVTQWWENDLAPSAKTSDAMVRLYQCTRWVTAWPLLANVFPEDRYDEASALAWLAVYEEACRWGFEVSDAQIEGRLETLRDLGMRPERWQRILNEVAGGQQAVLREALRTDMTLRAYIGWLLETVSLPVEPELRREFVRIGEKIKVRLLILEADDFLDQAKPPSDEEVRQQFEDYKKYPSGQGPKGFGYRIADRVAIEYLVADPAAFQADAQAAVTDKDVEKYYETHKDPEFLLKEDKPLKDEAESPSAEKDPDEKDAEAAAPEPPKQFRPLDEVRGEIRAALVRSEAQRLAYANLRDAAAEIRSKRKPPDLLIWADGEKIRYVAVEKLQSAEELAAMPGLGEATSENQRLADRALALVELVGPEKGRLAVKEISDIFTDSEGRAYAFRVTAYEGNHEPASLDEVRPKVEADLGREAAFALAQERGRQILERAAEEGLERAAQKAGIKKEITETDWFPREVIRMLGWGGQWVALPPPLPGVGSDAQVVAECFSLNPESKKQSLLVLTRPPSGGLDRRRAVLLVELADREGLREAAYQDARTWLAEWVESRLAETAYGDVFQVGAIRRRLGVIYSPPQEERGTSEETPDQAAKED